MQVIITHMARQLVRVDTKDGKPKQVEYLTYKGEARITDFRDVPFSQEFEIGKYLKPNVVTNTNQRYNPETGQPINPEKIISGQRPVYDTELEIPKDAAKRKKMIDNIIGDNDPNAIQFYYNELGVGNLEQKSDNTFSYDEFVSLSINELMQLSAKSGGGRSSGYWRDNQGKLHSRHE